MLGCLMLCQKALGYCDAEHSLKLPHDITELDLQNYVFLLNILKLLDFFFLCGGVGCFNLSSCYGLLGLCSCSVK